MKSYLKLILWGNPIEYWCGSRYSEGICCEKALCYHHFLCPLLKNAMLFPVQPRIPQLPVTSQIKLNCLGSAVVWSHRVSNTPHVFQKLQALLFTFPRRLWSPNTLLLSLPIGNMNTYLLDPQCQTRSHQAHCGCCALEMGLILIKICCDDNIHTKFWRLQNTKIKYNVLSIILKYWLHVEVILDKLD